MRGFYPQGWTVLLAIAATLVVSACSWTKTGRLYDTWTTTIVETVRIHTEPPGCRVYVEDSPAGKSPVTHKLRYDQMKVYRVGQHKYKVGFWETTNEAKNRRYTQWSDISPYGRLTYEWNIRAVCDGYEPATKVLTIVPSRDSRFIQAIAATDVVAGNRFPTEIEIDGFRDVLVAATPIPSVGAQAPTGQQQQQQQQVVIPGAQGETGTVTITSVPQSSDVFIDGIFAGNTPASLKLDAGIHIVEVRKEGYSTYRRELRVFADSELAVRAELESD